MITPAKLDQHAFDRLAADGHTLIPVVREVLSDLDTPLSVYLKLADGPHTYLFESVEGGERFGRYSIIGLPARRVYEFRGHTLDVREHGEVVETRELDDPLAEVERLRAEHKVPKIDGLPGFTGGLVGWFGFECIEYIEKKLVESRLRANPKPDELGTPDILLMLSEELAVFDNLKGRLYLIVHADPRQPQAFDFGQWIIEFAGFDDLAVFAHVQRVAMHLVHAARRQADDRIAAEAFAAFHRFEQVGMRAVGQLEVHGQRGIEVGEDLAHHGNQGVAVCGQPVKGVLVELRGGDQAGRPSRA